MKLSISILPLLAYLLALHIHGAVATNFFLGTVKLYQYWHGDHRQKGGDKQENNISESTTNTCMNVYQATSAEWDLKKGFPTLPSQVCFYENFNCQGRKTCINARRGKPSHHNNNLHHGAKSFRVAAVSVDRGEMCQDRFECGEDKCYQKPYSERFECLTRLDTAYNSCYIAGITAALNVCSMNY